MLLLCLSIISFGLLYVADVVNSPVRLETKVSKVLKGDEGNEDQQVQLVVQVPKGWKAFKVKLALMASEDPRVHQWVERLS